MPSHDIHDYKAQPRMPDRAGDALLTTCDMPRDAAPRVDAKYMKMMPFLVPRSRRRRRRSSLVGGYRKQFAAMRGAPARASSHDKSLSQESYCFPFPGILFHFEAPTIQNTGVKLESKVDEQSSIDVTMG